MFISDYPLILVRNGGIEIISLFPEPLISRVNHLDCMPPFAKNFVRGKVVARL